MGLPGLLAALLGEAFLMLTDYDPQVVPVTHACELVNGFACHCLCVTHYWIHGTAMQVGTARD